MKFPQILKDNILGIALICFVTLTIEIFLMVYHIVWWLRIYIAISIVLIYLLLLFMEYQKKKNFYKELFANLNSMDQKYLVKELLPVPTFEEARLLESVLEDTEKSMAEHVNSYKHLQEEYKEYIELWIHEIKLPIATSKLIIENNKNEVTKTIDEELDKIENYVEQALFYARSNTVEKDYTITKNNIQDIVHTVIKKNKSSLLAHKIQIETHDLEEEVYTDSKWVIFILNQIVANSINYSNPHSKIEFYCQEKKNNIILHIKDNRYWYKKRRNHQSIRKRIYW